MPVKTAIERGLLRLSSQWPPEVSRKPSDQVDSVSSAEADIERWVREIKSNPEMSQQLLTTGKATVEAKLARRKSGDGNFSFTQTVVTKPKVTEHVVSETKHFKVKSVVDPRTKTEISVNEAIHRGLLDMSKGLFIHPITEERMSIESALSRGFVRGVEASEPSQGSVKETKAFSIVGVIHPRTGQKIPVSQAVKEGILDLEQGLYCGVDSKGKIQKLKISEAVEKGFVVTDDDSSIKGSGGILHETRTYQLKSVYNPKTKQKIDVADAIKQGLIDESKGLYIHPFSGEKFSIPEAIEKKLIEAELMSVISNQEGEGSKIITTKQTTLMVKFVVDPRTGEHLSITKAVDEGILDGKMEKYINPMTGEVISLNEAIDKKLVITQQAAIDRSSSSSTESIHIGNEEEIVESSMVEEISSETVTFSINSVIDPRTMEMMSYDDAIRYGVLDVSRGLYRNPLTGETTPINVALEKGLIHGEVTSKVKEEDKLLSTVNASNSSFPFKKISSVVDQSDGSEISLIKAVKDGIIDVENGTYFDVNTVQNIPLELALKKGYIKLSKATDASDIERMQIKSDRKASEREQRRKSTDSDLQSTVDMKMEKFNVSGQKGESAFADEVLNYSTAVEDKDERKGPLELHQQQGVRTWRQQEMAVVDNQSASSRSDSPIEESLESLPLTDGMSFQSAMKLGLIDARSGRIRDPDTKKYITIQEAIDKDVLDENKPAMRDILTGQSLTLRQCIDKGIIDPRTGKVNDKKAKAEKVAFRPDIDVKQTRPKPLNLLDTVATGLFDPNTGMITDPRSQRSYTLKEALAQHIIDGNLVSVLDRQTGDRLTLEAAVKQGIMDGVTAEVTTHLGERLPLMQAIQDGLVDNVFDKETSKFHDTLTGTDVPLEKALTEGHIRSTEAQVFDTSTGDVIPLDVAFKKGLVDVRTGEVTDKVTGKKMSPKEALKLGLLAIVGAPVLAGKAVYDAIKENSETERKLAEKKQFSPRPPVVAVNGNSPRSPVAAVNGNGYSSTEFNGSQAHRVNGVTPVNGDMHLQHTENVREVLQQPRTTIIFAKPGDQIRPSPPQSLFTEPASSMEYKAADRYTGNPSNSLVTSSVFGPKCDLGDSCVTLSQTSLDKNFSSSEDSKSLIFSNSLNTSFTDSGSVQCRSKVLKANGCEINLTKYMLPGKLDSDEEAEFEMNRMSKSEVVAYTESLLEDFWDTSKEKWIHPRTGKCVHMQEAIDCGLISPELLQVKQANGKTVNIQKAINSGQINIHSGKTINLKTALNWPFHVAVAKGLIKVSDNEPIGKCDMYTELGPGLVSLIAQKEIIKETKILDRRLDQWVDISHSVESFIFDTEWGKVKDNITGKWMTWNEAKEIGLVLDPRIGEVASSSNEGIVKLKESDKHIVNLKEVKSDDGRKEYGGHILFNQNPSKSSVGRRHSTDLVEKTSMSFVQRRCSLAITEKSSTTFPIMLDMAIRQGLYNALTNTLHNPKDGSKMPFEVALQKGLIHRESLIRDPVSRDIISLQEAIENRIIDPESGKMIDSNEQAIALNFALNIGLIMRSQSPLKLSLSEIVEEGLFDEELGTFLNPDNNEEISFGEAVTSGLIDQDSIRVRDSKTGRVCKLDSALDMGLLYFDSGVCVDIDGGKKLPVLEALEKGILIDVTNQPKLTLKITLEDSYFNPKTNMFRDEDLGVDITIGDAIESGFLDGDSALVRDPKSLTVMTLDAALHENIIDPISGKYNSGGIEMGLNEAIDKGLVLFNATHGALPCSVIEAIRFNIYDSKSKTFVDPKSGDVLSLEKAIEVKLIDPKKTMVKDTSTGRFISLMNAEYLGIVNTKSSEITMLKEDDVCDVQEAKSKGILRRSASDEHITLKTAIGKGYVDQRGKIFDSLSKKKLNLADAILVRVINPGPTLVKNVKTGSFIPIVEAIASGIIDDEHCTFTNNESGKISSLIDAVEEGFIIEIPVSGLTIAEALQHGLYDEKLACFLDVRTGKTVNLVEAIEQRLIDPCRRQVVVPGTGLFSLKEAFDLGFMDELTGNYLFEDEQISLQEAVDRFLLVTVGSKKRNKTMSDSCYEQDDFSNSWNDYVVKDPNERRFLNMETAIEEGIIDIQTASYCDMKNDFIIPMSEAINAGFVVHSHNPRLGLASAFNLGIYDTVNNTIFDPSTSQEMSLSDALKVGLIDVNRTRVKCLETGKYLSLKQALKKGYVSDKTGSVFDRTQKKTFTLDIAVHQNLMFDFTKEKFTVPEGLMYGMLTHDGLMVEDLNTGNFLTFDDAVERGIIDAYNTTVQNINDAGSVDIENDSMSLTQAIQQNLVDESSGFLKLKSGRRMSLAEAVNKSYIIEKSQLPKQITDTHDSLTSSLEHSSLFDGSELTVLQRSLENELNMKENQISSNCGSLTDMDMTGSVMSDRSDSVSSPIRFDEALKFGFLDLENGIFFDYLLDEKLPIEKAASQGRLSIKRVFFNDPVMNVMVLLKDALAKNLLFQVEECGSESVIVSKAKPMTFKQALDQGLLVIKSKHFSGSDDDVDQLSVKSDTFSELVMSNTNLNWLSTNKNVSSSLDSLIQNVKHDQSGYRIGTLFDAIEKGLFDSDKGLLQDTFTLKRLSIKDAVASGLINSKNREVIDPNKDECISVEEAINRNIIDSETGMYIDPLTGSQLKLSIAKEAGYIVKSQVKFQCKSSVEIYVEEILTNEGLKGKNKYHDAFSTGVLSRSKSEVIDPDTVKPITLKRAGSLGMIDVKTGEFKNPHSGDSFSLADAVDKGFILSPKGLSLYSAVNQGLYNENTGHFKSPASADETTLRDLIERDVITDSCKEVRDVDKDGEVIKLREGIKRKVIDDIGGKYVSKQANLNFREAVSAGLIISNIPREGLRESSNNVETIPGMKPDEIWKGNLRKQISVRQGPTVNFKPSKQSKSNDQKVSSSTSSMESNSSGYETNHSQNQFGHDESGLKFVAEVSHLKAVHFIDDADSNCSKSLADSTVNNNKLSKGPVHGVCVIVNSEPTSSNRNKGEMENANQGHTGSFMGQGHKLLVSPQRNKEFLFSPGLPPSVKEERQQLSDSHDKLVSDLHNELNWVSDVEQLLKDDQPVSEEAYKAQSQREVLKALYDDVLGHQQPIRSLVYQSEQLVEHHQEELTPEQVTELQNLESVMKTSYGKVQKTCESRMKHLSTATDELTKFEAELKKFSSWLGTTEQELQRQIEAIQIVDGVTRVKDQHKEMQSDIIAHTADLRYLSYPLKTYMEEAKAHNFISMDNKEVEVVLEKQKEAETRYNELKSECNKFGDKLTALVNKQKTFNESTWTMLSWLTDTEEKLSMTRQESSAPEPEALREALEKMKAVGNDTIAHKNQMAELEKCGKEVITQMAELGIHGEQIAKIQEIIDDIAGRHDIISEEVNEKANELQTAVTKSQDVQDAVENLLTWLKDTDRKLDLQKLVSLNQEKLKEQEQQLSIIEKDIESHQPSVESVKLAARELIKTCDLDMAKALEGKINDISTRFLGVQKKSRSSLAQVNTVSEGLQRFNENLDVLRAWVQINTDSLESSEWSKKPIDQLKNKVDAVKLEKDRQMQAVQQLKTTGQNLIQDPRTSDPNAIKMALANMDQLWAKFEECLNERDAEASLKESRESDYECMKDEVVRWLSAMETSVDAFEPVAVDMDIVSRQIEELQPMIQEHYEFSPRIDELNTVGNAYDAIQAGDSRPKSPMRFRTRRYPSSMTSPRIRSPSPTTGSFPFGTELTSPMSASSDSSGVGSRKSSSDFLHLDDLSETQQDLVDMNQRYEMLEERLLDRQQELKGMLDTVKSFLQDLADVLSWLDARERDLDVAVAVATSEKEAKRRLKEHERSHAEVLAKETLVEDIRRKGQDLIKRKRGVPGIDMVQQQLSELDDKWLGVKVASEQQRKLLEDIVSDLRTYKDAGVHLQKWIAQKDKMVAVLGPVATEPSMIKNQLEQVKVLQEEMKGQEPLYDKFIQSGNAVHDKCVPDSQDAAHISEKMTVISKSWEKLGDKLRERESSLNSVEELSQNFSDTLQYLTAWLGDYMTTLDQLPPVASSPEKHKEHLKEIHELESERKKHVPILDQAKEIAKKLADNTKDANTKFEIKNKIASIEKPMFEAERKLQTRSNDLSKVSEQGAKLRASCQDLVALLGDLEQKAAKNEPVSGDPETLKVQVQKNK
ncbi:hypothetical protein DPMN_073948, partial [Dreissena polymorpha]